MRTSILASVAIAALGLAGAASAAPASVDVRVGPELQEKAKDYGARDIEMIAQDLQKTVSHQLARSMAYDGQRIELTLVDAKPNRPTPEQMSRRIGLSMWSFGIGGAEISGRAIAPDGTVTPLGYRWYETDIRQSRFRTTWGDAQTVFQRFAHRLASGGGLAMR